MKKLILIITLLITVNSYSQAPQSLKYQATARNGSGNLTTNQQVGMQISVIQENANGAIIYIETFTPTTDNFGLININIGTGNSSGNFSAINWKNGPYFIKIEMDVTGGTNYQDFGTSQLLSVPYALYANNSATSNYTFNPSYPNGFQNITPITEFISESIQYTVPVGKILYILNICLLQGGFVRINSHNVARGAFNSGQESQSQHLCQPLIADENDILDCINAECNFNGYLIDK